ncbi:MAG TPA: hypothetical protein VF530_15450 [Planctomycetota bacterium]
MKLTHLLPSLVLVPLFACAGPRAPQPAAPATPATPAASATPATPAPAMPAPVARASGKPEIRYYEISAA